MAKPQHDLVVVANRLPVDLRLDESGNATWKRAPGGLVTALAPLMQSNEGAWVGWPGMADLAIDPFDSDGIWMVPVSLSETEIAEYYEGFSNDTLWPLYHDVIARPSFHREWWDTYREVNEHFASMADYAAAEGATVWVHDYQLQLVPALLRAARPDLRIGYFHHIPFPPLEIFSQLPWRRQIVEGLLGADLVGFQRSGDAANFLRSVRKLTDHTTSGQLVEIDDAEDRLVRQVKASAFPISIDSGQFDKLAQTASVRARAAEIREELGNPDCILLGVDRLDYTKGILHRIKAFSELLRDGDVDPAKVTMVQVASPSRENVDAYQQLRDEVEVQVGRINGEFGGIGRTVINYLHHSYPMEEMAAFYLASDVMLVTSLRDGMNLVAKEYVAARSDDRGVLVLSEFTGAAEELTAALLINPHDIDGTKAQVLAAINMPVTEQRRRMRRLRRRVLADDVAKWSNRYLATLTDVATSQPERVDTPPSGTLGASLREALQTFSHDASPVLVASDFDGVLAPLVDDPATSRTVPRALRALRRIAALPRENVALALVSGRSLETLAQLSNVPPGTHLLGSHGAERGIMTADGLRREELALSEGEQSQLRHVTEGLEAIAARHYGVWVEKKPSAAALHTRLTTHDGAEQATEAALELASRLGLQPLLGKNVVEIAVVQTTKGRALDALRSELGASHVVYMGDDATDEHAFAVLGQRDVAIKVGPGDSIAPYRIADSSAAALVLERLGALLSAHIEPGRRRRKRA
ncbi:bifunctional alpha,alpha-trehalose-phosphate synthase (UDP-forming)/trehalose-phosphatase [Rarobacter faecitabidus]|uniref:Trehalose 6-phosphate synthase/phosphatase n=1 Tax=Rarobacter faecitabidus TaxID=13243 RepID=A0A542ZTU7_RARFA|nr:bifunctional alpha,alpha-trehalose-phosphate synthase (UDP-forming)/trehalose-phosphatase [Rarobacter faecitabidus]TQL63709.1 trehalose 6-phosphate synthase/phosphatase [Rarobacter faecitabidus]